MNKARGLTSQEVASLREKHGPNELPREERPGPGHMFLQQFREPLVFLLLGAAVISAVSHEWVDAIAIVAIVLINAVIGVVQEYRAEKALDALKDMAAPLAKVMRDGSWQIIPSRELVPGDLVTLESGDRVPADLIVVESSNLKVDEAILTGESLPVEKGGETDDTGIYAGTVVVYGRATAKVDRTGSSTRMGQLAGQIAESPDEEPPLKKKLAEMSKTLAFAGIGLVLATFAIGIFRGEPLLTMFLAAVSLGVAAIPEGLPAIVTVVLALGVQRMSARNAIVRKLASVETLGSVTVICSDKTGTLTMSEMQVTEVLAGGRRYSISGKGYEPVGEIKLLPGESVPGESVPGESIPGEPAVSGESSDGSDARGPFAGLRDDITALCLAGLLNSDANIQKTDRGFAVVGDPTEGALVVAAAKRGFTRDSASGEYPRVFEIPFESDRKMMTTVHRMETTNNGQYFSITKGAPHRIIEQCNSLWQDGGARPMTDADRSNLMSVFSDMASRALRVIAVGFRVLDTDFPRDMSLETQMVFLGFWGMIDPPRPESKRAVAVCKRAGIRPVMITGDQAPTALAIAQALGIAKKDDKAVVGGDLEEMDEDTLLEVARKTNVYAQTSPLHKSRIVSALKRDGHIVAMTGDGVNDAPALKWADIGVAMGIKGTDVSKEAADMVLADDNFATIVSAVEEGRTIYSNIRKAVKFLLAANLGELITVIGSIVLGTGSPLTAAQILWVNLATDSAPAIALGMERPEDDVIKNSPPDPKQSVFSKDIIWRLVLEGLFIGATSLGSYLLSLSGGHSQATARTVCFGVLVFSQLFHAYNSRSLNRSLFGIGPFSSRAMNIAVGASVALQMAAMLTPLGTVLGLTPLSQKQWYLLVGLGFSVIPFVEISKALGRPSHLREDGSEHEPNDQ